MTTNRQRDTVLEWLLQCGGLPIPYNWRQLHTNALLVHDLIHYKGPMLPSPLPKHPWEKVTSNLFVFNGKHCVNINPAPSGAGLIFTHYLEVIQLNATTSASVILAGSSSSLDMEVHILWWMTVATIIYISAYLTCSLTMLPARLIISASLYSQYVM